MHKSMKRVMKRMPDGTHYLPLRDDKKTPICPFKDLDPAPITKKAKQQQNYGVRCAQLVCVDCDLDKEGQDIQKQYKKTYTQKTGGGGFHYIYIRDERMVNWKARNNIGPKLYDIKIGPNSYFIGAGSKSSKGSYTIIKKIKPKRMPDGLFHEIDQLFQTPKSKSVKKKKRIKYNKANMSIVKKKQMNQNQMIKILKCLQHLADNYDQWVEVGMILKNEYGDEGLPMWIEWSRKDNGYSGEPDSMYQKHWDSFESGGLGVGTLMFHLKAHSQADYFFCVNSQALDVSHASLAKIFFDLYGSEFFKQDREIFHWNGVFWESADDLFTHEIGFTFCDFWRNLSQMYSKEGANSSDESTKAKADLLTQKRLRMRRAGGEIQGSYVPEFTVE